jgi:hypothetical protein
MLPGNFESSNMACIIGEDLRSAVVQVRNVTYVSCYTLYSALLVTR